MWNALFGGPAPEKHSLKELERLHGVLRNNLKVNEQNRAAVVETLRACAELLIWGDQNDSRVFEYFLEHNILQHFKTILESPEHQKGEVAIQLLQTLSILITNLRKDTSLYYLFSNNHINEIAQLVFDFTDEEVLAHYITFMKAISFKLNPSTIQFFFQTDANGLGTFPLYTESVKLFNHPEGMVRASVRMLSINIYSVQDTNLQNYISSSPCNNYFHEIALHLADLAVSLDRQLTILQEGQAPALELVNSHMSEAEDTMAYISDILDIAQPQLASEVTRALWDAFLLPVALRPLMRLQDVAPPDEVPAEPLQVTVRPVTALYIIERLLVQQHNPVMVDLLACAMFAGAYVQRTAFKPPGTTEDSAHVLPPAQYVSYDHSPAHLKSAPFKPGTDQCTHGETDSPSANSRLRKDEETKGGGGNGGDAADTPSRPVTPSEAQILEQQLQLVRCRTSLLGCLRSTDPELCGGAMRALLALFKANLSESVRGALGLVRGGHPTGGNSLEKGVSGNSSTNSVSNRLRSGSKREFSIASTTSEHLIDDLVMDVVINSFNPYARAPSASLSLSTPRLEDELVDALIGAVCNDHATAVTTVAAGWLLQQLLPPAGGSGGSALPPQAAGRLRRSQAAAAVSLGDAIASQWTDALTMMVHTEWPVLRPIALRGEAPSSASALLRWLVPTDAAPRVIRPLAASAVAAVRALRSVQRVCAVTQVDSLLSTASIPPEAPILPLDTSPHEVREGDSVSSSLGPRLPCRVSFRRGEEKTVYLALAPTRNGLTSPQVVLSESWSSDEATCRVMSSAPLIPSAPKAHERHAQWLHCTVRPSVAMLKSMLAAARKQGLPFGLSRAVQQLVDGMWVLSFSKPSIAAEAIAAMETSIKIARNDVAHVLAPLRSANLMSDSR